MPAENISLSLLSVISLISFFVFLLTSKYSNKIWNGILLDQDFNKPQAFHSLSIPRSGGLAASLSFLIFFIFYYLLFNKVNFEYVILTFAMFSMGFIEDIKLNFKPIYRLILMIIILLIFTIYFSINITSIDLNFLNSWLKNDIFSIIFVLLCFLFIVNGSNLIDGFNGLLAIHILIINIILLFINLENNHENLSIMIASQIVILISFLLFNFPKAQIFLGDSGSYLIGTFIAIAVINTSISNTDISPFFFCILLFYLFFEVFFSFFRKFFVANQSPLLPDNQHLHMLVYKFLLRTKYNKLKANYVTSIYINSIYFLLIIPGIIFFENNFFCKYYFLFLLLTYIYSYKKLK